MHSLPSYSWKAGRFFHLSAIGNRGIKFFVQGISGGLCWKDLGPTLQHFWICIRWHLTWHLYWWVGTSDKGGLVLIRTHSGLWNGFCSTLREMVDTGMVRRCLCSSLISGRGKNLITKLWGWQTQADFFFFVNNTQCLDSHLSASVFCFLSVSLPNSICC